jgi:large subunit ribosomal protein L17
MNHGRNLLKLSRTSKPRKRLLRNLVTSLVEHERIITTKAKARAMRGLADKVISLAKKPHLTLNRRKQLLNGILYRKDSVDKVINELLPRYENKPGNYTVVKHHGYRGGDCAKMSSIEYHNNNYYLFEKDAAKDLLAEKTPSFTVKLLREEASFFQHALENLKTSSDAENKKKFFEKQLDRIQRELSLLDKSEIHVMDK